MRIEHKTGRVEVYAVGVHALRELRANLTTPNPKYLGAIRAGKKPIGIPQVLKFYDGDGEHLTIPAGCVGMAVAAADRHGEPLECIVGMDVQHEVDFSFAGRLRLYQMAALAQVTARDFGVLEAPTGSGKTVMGCAAIAQRRQPTLIVVHNKMLQAQWVEAVGQFLGVPVSEIKTIGGGREFPVYSPRVTVAIINSLAKCAEEIAPHIGHLVVDECHRVPAASYWRTLEHFGCRYRLGLSATPYRRDELDDAIQWALGPITTVERELLVRSGHVLPTDVEQVGTDFESDVDPREHYQAVISEVIADARRNMQIVDAAGRAIADGVVLVLSDRVDHLEGLHWYMCEGGAVLLHGGLGAAARREAVAALPTARIILATTQMVGEGFNLPAATTAILATPIKWSGRLLQAIGRVLRPAPGKTAGKIIDFCDWKVPVLASGARSRTKVYRQLRESEGIHGSTAKNGKGGNRRRQIGINLR